MGGELICPGSRTVRDISISCFVAIARFGLCITHHAAVLGHMHMLVVTRVRVLEPLLVVSLNIIVFRASTFMRDIQWICLPTTMTSTIPLPYHSKFARNP
jgi:hypothetical protein